MSNGDFYNAEEAMKILGMAKTTFYDEVNAGNIPYIIDKGRKRGKKFPKEAIHVHAQLLKKGEDIHRTFERATNTDLWTAIEYDKEIYGVNDIINYKKALEWKERNSEIFMMMKEGNELAGTITFIPLEESTIEALINDRIRERNIPLWAIRKWNESELSVYIPTISIFPSGNKITDKGRGRSLICFTLRWALALNRQYDLKNWYAIGTTQEGVNLLKGLGFKSVKGTREGYVLEDLETAMPIVKDFLKEENRDKEWKIPIVANMLSSTDKDSDKVAPSDTRKLRRSVKR